MSMSGGMHAVELPAGTRLGLRASVSTRHGCRRKRASAAANPDAGSVDANARRAFGRKLRVFLRRQLSIAEVVRDGRSVNGE